MCKGNMNEKSKKLAELIDESSMAVAFTGAGISTECGIPDFRSPGGFWSKNKPVYFDDFVRDPDVRREGWKRFLKLRDEHLDVKPGRGHKALAHLHKHGKLRNIITQNIDNLHQASGVPVQDIVELHGNGTYAKCLECAARYELDWCAERLAESNECPRCQACGGFVKSATISFGQAMPREEMARAEFLATSCDLILAIGTSLVVYPASGIPIIACKNGAKLVIINRDPTELDSLASLVINEDIGDVMEPFLTLYARG
ncbi:MAG: SIR2 family NAD-dependent protein deacylase [Hyphomicrobiales bacterium]